MLSAFLLTLACLGLNAQSSIKWGFELGASASQIPWKTQGQNANTSSLSKEIPVYSPVLGFTYQITLWEKLEINTGVQYQSSGYKNHEYNSAYFENHPFWGTHTYFSSTTQEFKVHKLNIPFTIGVKLLPASKIQPSVFMGYQPNFLLTGKYQVQLVTQRSNGQSDLFETNTNPVTQKFEPLKRIQHQWVAGVSTNISDRWRCTVSMAIGNYIYRNKTSNCYLTHGYNRNTNFNLYFSYLIPKNPRLINRDF